MIRAGSPDYTIAPEKSLSSRPLYASRRADTMLPPALSPIIVTRLGSPPNAAIFSYIHCRARRVSLKPLMVLPSSWISLPYKKSHEERRSLTKTATTDIPASVACCTMKDWLYRRSEEPPMTRPLPWNQTRTGSLSQSSATLTDLASSSLRRRNCRGSKCSFRSSSQSIAESTLLHCGFQTRIRSVI